MQAIITKYIGPTDHKGARIKAKCAAGSVTIGFPYADDDHAHAVLALLAKLDWSGAWVGGGLPDGTGDAYVCVDPSAPRSVNGRSE